MHRANFPQRLLLLAVTFAAVTPGGCSQGPSPEELSRARQVYQEIEPIVKEMRARTATKKSWEIDDDFSIRDKVLILDLFSGGLRQSDVPPEMLAGPEDTQFTVVLFRERVTKDTTSVYLKFTPDGAKELPAFEAEATVYFVDYPEKTPLGTKFIYSAPPYSATPGEIMCQPQRHLDIKDELLSLRANADQ